MGKLRAFEREAIRYINAQAKQDESKHKALIAQLCDEVPYNMELLIDHLLSSRVTINFHPDRYSSNGKKVIENLIHDGSYLSQYRTGTTNGGKTAYVGGDRFLWEQHLFAGAYPEIQEYAEMLTDKFNIDLRWIPMRQIKIDEIDDEFRGPLIKPIAMKIDRFYGNQ